MLPLPAPNQQRTVKREGSDPSDHEEPAAKRRRQLSETLFDLRKFIVAASENGKWHSPSCWCHDSVEFFVQELMQVLSNIVAEESAATGAMGPAAAAGAPDGAPKLLGKVYRFLTDVFMRFPMFDQVHHFKGIFPSLEEMGAPATGSGKLIELLAGVNAADSSQLDLSSFDVVDRNHFRRTELFRSYCERTFRLRMQMAATKLAATGACEFELRTALEIRPVSQGLLDTAKHALQIFHPEAAQDNNRAKLEYVISNKGITAFLKGFVPQKPITLASQMMLEETTFNAWSLDEYVTGARYSGI